MGKINDTQDQAIWDAISREHNTLREMYEQRKELEKKHEKELDDFIAKIGKQEEKVQELCEGRVKFYTDSESRVILDLTDRKVKE